MYVYLNIRVYIHVCIYGCMYVRICGRMDVWTDGCMDPCMHIYIYIHACMHACMHVYMYVCNILPFGIFADRYSISHRYPFIWIFMVQHGASDDSIYDTILAILWDTHEIIHGICSKAIVYILSHISG